MNETSKTIAISLLDLFVRLFNCPRNCPQQSFKPRSASLPLKKLSIWIVIGVVALSSGECFGGGRYGNINPDSQTMKDFDSFRIDPKVNYYYSGPDLFPNALIGLKKQYNLNSRLWKPFKPTPQSFRDMILHMQEKARDYREFQHGFIISDDKGKPIGIWYSILRARTTIIMGDGNNVDIYTPDLMIYESRPGMMFPNR